MSQTSRRFLVVPKRAVISSPLVSRRSPVGQVGTVCCAYPRWMGLTIHNLPPPRTCVRLTKHTCAPVATVQSADSFLENIPAHRRCFLKSAGSLSPGMYKPGDQRDYERFCVKLVNDHLTALVFLVSRVTHQGITSLLVDVHGVVIR